MFTQFDMALVLTAFFGNFVLFPEQYGNRFNPTEVVSQSIE